MPSKTSVIAAVCVAVVVALLAPPAQAAGNTLTRVRIDQALRFFWGPVTGVAVVALLLARMGW